MLLQKHFQHIYRPCNLYVTVETIPAILTTCNYRLFLQYMTRKTAPTTATVPMMDTAAVTPINQPVMSDSSEPVIHQIYDSNYHCDLVNLKGNIEAISIYLKVIFKIIV